MRNNDFWKRVFHRQTASSGTFTVGSSSLDAGITYNIDQIIMHAEYDWWLLYNDIALLIFTGDNAIVFSELVGPIPIQTEDIGGDIPCTLTGWGSTQVSTNFHWIKTSLLWITCLILEFKYFFNFFTRLQEL